MNTDQLNANQQLFTDLKAILFRKGLTWTSDGDEKIKVVRVSNVGKYLETQEPNGDAEKRLQAQIDMALPEEKETFIQLRDRLKQEDTLISVKRPRPEPNEFDLFILVYFRWYYVGIKVLISET